MDILIKNIKELIQVRDKPVKWVAGKEMQKLPIIKNAFLFIKDGLIKDYGPNDQTPDKADKIIDATGKLVLPGFVDSHTHIVFPHSREEEFVDKIRGLSYEQIAERGGGILNSARKLALMSENALYEVSKQRLEEVVRTGTVAIEIKSGYGLSTENELKILRVARLLGENTNVAVKTTFLGAHAIPEEYRSRPGEYVDLVINEMIPAVVEEKLADYIDVFCERGFFSADDTYRIVEAGKKYGLKPKIHANQLSLSGGVQTGVETGAISVDHLECMSEKEIKVLQNTNTMPTSLPGSAFFLDATFTPARKMIDSGLPLAIATDYNPGSAPSGSMPFMLSLACIKMRMTPEEAINAATVNTAYAMEVGNEYGSITPGKVASVMITKPVPSLSYLPYSFGTDNIETVILKGREIIEKNAY